MSKYKFTICKEIELSDKEIELLKSINKNGSIEYRDSDSYTYLDYRSFYGEHISEELFNKRNHNGTLADAESLENKKLITTDMSWHTTYVITKLGEELLKQYERKN